ncbi:MAG TPA: hypothetical protein VMF08_20435 [Candidatus Sulfotelmatobacter sp.]|nr:hypothetical protein [Candidatus Sulfotelmatobacter sp.]
MTAEQLIEEGRKLQRPCFLLRPEVSGEVAAVWYERSNEELFETGRECWLTVDARFVPGFTPPLTGFISVFTQGCERGHVEISNSWPERKGTKLYAHPASILPPLDAVFARGSEAVDEWLRANDWERGWRYNRNFKDKATVKAYGNIFFKEYPLYFESDIYAMLGGWHFPGQDPDWEDLIDEQLMVLTFRESEPWVETWRMKSGDFKVIQRIT